MNKNKLHKMIPAVVSVAILTFGGLLFNQIHKHHQANKLIIEKCFDQFDEQHDIVIKKDGFWSPVSCEMN